MLQGIVQRARENQKVNENDYIKDGILHCGVCGEPKEKVFTEAQYREFGIERVPIICKCDEKALNEAQKSQKRHENQMIVNRLRASSLMDTKYKTSTFDKFIVNDDNRENLELCKRYVTKFNYMLEKGQGLLFYGKVGVGKSFLAACMANYLLNRGLPLVMTSLVKVLEQIQVNPRQEEELLSTIRAAKLVIFDDFGAERSTDYALEKIYNIIDERYRSGRPMILTTNLSLEEMMEATDIRYQRIYNRVLEVCYPMEFKGKNWRIEHARANFTQMKGLLDE